MSNRQPLLEEVRETKYDFINRFLILKVYS